MGDGGGPLSGYREPRPAASDELFCVLDSPNSVYNVFSKRRPKGGDFFFCVIFINELDIRLFGYSISERARAPILREKGTVEPLSIADGLTWTPAFSQRIK